MATNRGRPPDPGGSRIPLVPMPGSTHPPVLTAGTTYSTPPMLGPIQANQTMPQLTSAVSNQIGGDSNNSTLDQLVDQIAKRVICLQNTSQPVHQAARQLQQGLQGFQQPFQQQHQLQMQHNQQLQSASQFNQQLQAALQHNQQLQSVHQFNQQPQAAHQHNQQLQAAHQLGVHNADNLQNQLSPYVQNIPQGNALAPQLVNSYFTNVQQHSTENQLPQHQLGVTSQQAIQAPFEEDILMNELINSESAYSADDQAGGGLQPRNIQPYGTAPGATFNSQNQHQLSLQKTCKGNFIIINICVISNINSGNKICPIKLVKKDFLHASCKVRT